MCGIVAALSRGKLVDKSALLRGMEALHHRGPDGRGVWVSEDRRVGLGHTRLSIIDLTGGSQPISNEDGTIHIVVNGEFYDFERIRNELIEKGHQFATGSDSEIAIHLYEEYGASALQQLRGEFAFVLWDETNRTLFAARDRFGIKPLHYAVSDGVLYIASEAKALFAAGVPARWDEESFYSCVNIQYLLTDRSLFKGIYQLPPGHYLLATDHNLQRHRYWDLDYAPEGSVPPRSEEEYIEAFRHQLEEAVRLRLRADVPVGCYLSGGIDSCSVLALAMQHASRPIECFTISFDVEDYDEGAIAKEMAAKAGGIFHPIDVKASDIWSNFPEAVWHGEALYVNGHGAGKYLLSKAVREAGMKVVLCGEGSDEILAGYPHFRRDLFIAQAEAEGRSPDEILSKLDSNNPVSAGILLPEGERLPLDFLKRTLGFVPTFLETKSTLGFRTMEVLSEDFKKQFAGRDCYRIMLQSMDVAGQLIGRHRVNQSSYLWTKLALPNYLIQLLGDRVEMANSVEVRLPFLDHHLVELTRTLPVSLKIKGEREKHILRAAVRPLLTETVFNRQKHPFLAPPLSSTMDELLQDSLRGPSFAAVPFYDRKKIIELLDRLPTLAPRQRTATDPILMMALSASILQERAGLS